jgi:hypothetical protein
LQPGKTRRAGLPRKPMRQQETTIEKRIKEQSQDNKHTIASCLHPFLCGWPILQVLASSSCRSTPPSPLTPLPRGNRKQFQEERLNGFDGAACLPFKSLYGLGLGASVGFCVLTQRCLGVLFGLPPISLRIVTATTRGGPKRPTRPLAFVMTGG